MARFFNSPIFISSALGIVKLSRTTLTFLSFAGLAETSALGMASVLATVTVLDGVVAFLVVLDEALLGDLVGAAWTFLASLTGAAGVNFF